MICPECSKEISDHARICPHCGYPVQDKVLKIETELALHDSSINHIDEELEASNNEPDTVTQKKQVSKYFVIGLFVVLIIGIFMVSTNTLSGDDKIAYDLLSSIQGNFKDPSSVQLVGGTVSSDGDTLYARISATNSFGARGTDNYIVEKGSVLQWDDSTYSYIFETDGLNLKKINKKLSSNY